jgi:hypothetical protein
MDFIASIDSALLTAFSAADSSFASADSDSPADFAFGSLFSSLSGAAFRSR